jgi:hypothetical protein
MPLSFYARRFLQALVIATIVVTTAQYLKGHALNLAAPDGLLWGTITAAVYTSVLAYKLRNSACHAKAAPPAGS